MTRITQEKHRGSRGLQWLDGKESVAFVRCRICGDYRRVISGRHLSKHGVDRDTYMDEYRLSPDELIAKEFRKRQSSRRGYHPHGRSDWIAAIKKIYKRDGQIFAGYLQDKYPHLYNQGAWLFGDWDNALCEAGFEPEKMRMTGFWDQERVIREIHGLRKNNLPLYAKYVMQHHPRLFSAALRQCGSWDKALLVAGIKIPKYALGTGGRLGILTRLEGHSRRDAPEPLKTCAVYYFGSLEKAIVERDNRAWQPI